MVLSRLFRQFFVFICILTFLGAADAYSASIVVIQGDRSSFGRKYFSGFSSLSDEKISAFHYDGENAAALVAKTQKMSPDLILTIGDAPLDELTKKMPATPIIVGHLDAVQHEKSPNLIVVDNRMPIQTGVTLAQFLFPTRKTIGTVYNPAHSQARFDHLTAKAKELGVRIASIKVDTPKDIKEFIQAFAGKVELFYWFSDPTTSNKESVQAIYSFMENNNIPVISMDPAHIEKGALLTVSMNPFEMGEHAWRVAKFILKNAKYPKADQIPEENEITASISLKTLSRFGVGSDALFAFLGKTVKEKYVVKILN